MVCGLAFACSGDDTANPSPSATSELEPTPLPTRLVTRMELPVKVAVTLPIFEEWVRIAAEGNAEVVSLIPEGVDPATYTLTDDQVAELGDFDFIFTSGFGIDEHLTPVIEANLKETGRVVPFGPNIDSPSTPGLTATKASDEAHIWMDPWIAHIYAEIISDTFVIYDSVNRSLYQQTFRAYQDQTRSQSSEITMMIDEVPKERRVVLAPDSFTHFARRFDIDIVDTDRSDEAFAALVEGGVDSPDIERSASDAGLPVCIYYTTPASGGFETYLEMMQANAESVLGCVQSS